MPASRPATTSLRAIRRSVAQIERSLAVLAKALQSTSAAPVASRKGRKLRLSPARKAALAIQGEYIGHMRHLGARDKARRDRDLAGMAHMRLSARQYVLAVSAECGHRGDTARYFGAIRKGRS